MKRSASWMIGTALLVMAICFVGYATGHPELSFPWNNRVTFLLYGAYAWLLFRFLLEIPLRKKPAETVPGAVLGRTFNYFLMSVIFYAMEQTGAKVDAYTILRGFLIAGGLDLGAENLLLWLKSIRR